MIAPYIMHCHEKWPYFCGIKQTCMKIIDLSTTNLAIASPKYIHVWRVIFMGANFSGKSEKALKINFRGFKFRDSNQSRGVALHKR